MVDAHACPILIVDDEKSVRDVIEASLRRVGYTMLFQAESVEQARRLMKTDGAFAIVLLDIRLPQEDGMAFLRDLALRAPHTAVIMATGLMDIATAVEALRAGAYDYLVKPLRPDAVQLAVARALRRRRLELDALQRREQIEQVIAERTEALEATRHAVLMGLCQMVEFRDAETGAHLRRLPEYARVLALDMMQNSPYAGLIDETFVERLVESAPLHDIGKVAVPDKVLLKPDKLTPEEFEQVKLHTTSGRDVCLSVKNTLRSDQSSFVDMAIDITHSHHERWDGRGYPEGRAGTDVPLSSRIVHLVDFFDACRSSRVYRADPIPLDEVVAMIRDGSGTDFDPHVVDSFMRCLDKILAIERGEET